MGRARNRSKWKRRLRKHGYVTYGTTWHYGTPSVPGMTLREAVEDMCWRLKVFPLNLGDVSWFNGWDRDVARWETGCRNYHNYNTHTYRMKAIEESKKDTSRN